MSINVIKFLSGFVNRTEDINELLNLFLVATKSEGAMLFVRDDNTNYYKCVANSTSDINVDLTIPTESVTITIGAGEEISTDYNIKNSMSIPIKNLEEQLGLLFLFNREEGYQ